MNGSIKTKLDVQAYYRDNFSCVDCGKDTGLEAHHIIEGLEELSNLVTLCHGCHKKRHNMAGCFTNGYDPRRNINAGIQNMKLGRLLGHSFRGNQYVKIN